MLGRAREVSADSSWLMVSLTKGVSSVASSIAPSVESLAEVPGSVCCGRKVIIGSAPINKPRPR